MFIFENPQKLTLYLTQNNLQDPYQPKICPCSHHGKASCHQISQTVISSYPSRPFSGAQHNPSLWLLEFVKWHGNGLLQETWMGSTSALCRHSTSVPQGSVRGLLLFSLYTRSLGEVISSHEFPCHYYADDIPLILSFSPAVMDLIMSGRKLFANLIFAGQWGHGSLLCWLAKLVLVRIHTAF